MTKHTLFTAALLLAAAPALAQGQAQGQQRAAEARGQRAQGLAADAGTPGAGTATGHMGHAGGHMMGAADAGGAAEKLKGSEARVVQLTAADGKPAGEVSVTPTTRGLLLKGRVQNLPPGPHAIHVHETGKCEAPFKSAGGHFNPTKKAHGYMAAKGSHLGDLPNFVVNQDGRGEFEMHADGLTLGKGAGNVLDPDGSALVVHAGPDDYTTDPAGASGDRIACGTLTK